MIQPNLYKKAKKARFSTFPRGFARITNCDMKHETEGLSKVKEEVVDIVKDTSLEIIS